LAAALVEGRPVKEFAEEAGVILNTVRTHLKRMFHRAGVTRHLESIRLGPPAARKLGADRANGETLTRAGYSRIRERLRCVFCAKP
jgi:hypothetical protein